MAVAIAGLVLAVVGIAALVWFATRRTLAIALALLVVAVLAGIVGARVVWQPARVAGQAMAPTLREHDRLFVNRMAYASAPPQRGDIVMLQYPPRPSTLFVMRVVAVGGDRVELVSGRLHLNGGLVAEPFVLPGSRGTTAWGPAEVPAGHVFVMGDNRTNSSDSRHWGFVPEGHIMGRVQARWWPWSRGRTF